MVKCAKLGQELPGLDETTPEGDQALRMVQMIAGPEMRQRVGAHVSLDAWRMWKDHMLMIYNEYRLDPMSDQANTLLKSYMENFFFGEEGKIPNYVPPKQ